MKLLAQDHASPRLFSSRQPSNRVARLKASSMLVSTPVLTAQGEMAAQIQQLTMQVWALEKRLADAHAEYQLLAGERDLLQEALVNKMIACHANPACLRCVLTPSTERLAISLEAICHED